MDAEKIREEFGYAGKPKQWQVGFDALLKHMPDYQKEANRDSLVDCGAMRPLGFYEVKKLGKWTRAEWTEYGWKVLWSNWYQDDDDLDGMRDEKN